MSTDFQLLDELTRLRIEDAEQQAAPLIAAMDDLSEAEQVIVLPTLGRVGGSKAVTLVKMTLASPSAAIREAGFPISWGKAGCN